MYKVDSIYSEKKRQKRRAENSVESVPAKRRIVPFDTSVISVPQRSDFSGENSEMEFHRREIRVERKRREIFAEKIFA